MPFLTIFTPTYNRAYIIGNLYESLKKQTCKDFEWLVIDDGSTDETEKLFSSWISEKNDFIIRYLKQENSGKMQAVNAGARQASGKMFFTVDSDDYLPYDSVEKIISWESTINSCSGFAGIAGCKYFADNKITGSTFEGEYVDATSLERRKLNILGDKAEVFYTDVIKKYPFPKFDGEKFVPEALIFNRIAMDGYKFRWVNDNFYYCQYLDDGYTKNVNRNLIKNWKGYTLYIKELLRSKASVKEKIIPAAGYVYRSILKGFYK